METNEKHWWESRTIWLQIVAFIYAVGAGHNWWPEGLDESSMLAAVMAVVTIVSIILRVKTKAEIKPVIAKTENVGQDGNGADDNGGAA